MIDNERIIYSLLSEVFSDKAYSSITLNQKLKEISKASDRAYITKIFYGCIEKSIQFDFIIKKLCPKKPKSSVVILLKIGLYLLRYSSVPKYAAIDKTVSLSRSLGKGGISGFLNATLRKSEDVNLENIPYDSKIQYLSVIFSYPEWIIKMLIDEYGQEEANSFLSYEKKMSTHIRHNPGKITVEEFEQLLKDILFRIGSDNSNEKKSENQYARNSDDILLNNSTVQKTDLGYYVIHRIMERLPKNSFIPQSFSSMLAVHSYITKQEIEKYKIIRVLDVCAAPGGKAIYLKQLNQNLEITCCDIHSHRLELIKNYGNVASISLNLKENDATKINEEFLEGFDLVICDVPCSGLGVVNSKPDIVLNRKPQDIEELSKIQAIILKNSSKYLRKGGILCYSTCTVLKKENTDIINKFLQTSKGFEILPIRSRKANSDGTLLLLPQKDDCDGFFVARLKRKE